MPFLSTNVTMAFSSCRAIDSVARRFEPLDLIGQFAAKCPGWPQRKHCNIAAAFWFG